jgi:hydroxyethylthiazole kinase-like uncharacterized protein yjeF
MSRGLGDHVHLLFSVAQMYDADAGAMASGIPGIQLMTAAGTAVAEEIRRHYAPQETLILCGPGNNGGDGFVVATILARSGWPVRVALLGARESLRGDAAEAARTWAGSIEPLEPQAIRGASVIVDAIFGAGLARAVDGQVLATLKAVAESGARVIAVDIPSGVQGDSGEILGMALRADRTVTFAPKKTGHCLLPGRRYCGTVRVVPIGTPESVIAGIGAMTWENHPDLWLAGFPRATAEGNKYSRGYAIVVSGSAETTGAARLAARAALRMGAGLVGVACPPDALPILAASLTSVMTKTVEDAAELHAFASDRRRPAALIGPGCGVTQATREKTLALLSLGKRTVIDADALTVFADQPDALFGQLNKWCVLTPHDGEFARLFPDLRGSRLDRARVAAAKCGAVVLLKGGDTVVAEPGGRATVATNAPPYLATAGAGDVLAGFVLGLLSQGMPAFDAANAAVWLHGDAAARFGPGLIADDITESLPGSLLALDIYKKHSLI